MAGVEEETITVRIGHILRIVAKELGVEHIDKICTTHRATGMTRLSLLNHRRSENTNVIRCTLKFVVLHSLK